MGIFSYIDMGNNLLLGLYMSIRILIAEDEELVRTAFKLLVQSFEGFDVTGEAADGHEAVKMARELKPDVILMDMLMPVMNGIAATQEIKTILPQTKIVALTVVDNGPEIIEGLTAGIDGYLLKKVSPSELNDAIMTVMAGKRYICPLIAGHIADAYLDASRNVESPFAKVTPREMEVLECICEGKRAKEIATTLGISVKTAEKHRESLRHKLHADTTVELMKSFLKYKACRP
jgi:two-component system, NarL family, response regulator NreC